MPGTQDMFHKSASVSLEKTHHLIKEHKRGGRRTTHFITGNEAERDFRALLCKLEVASFLIVTSTVSILPLLNRPHSSAGQRSKVGHF